MSNKFVKNVKKGVFAGVATLMVAGGALTATTSTMADAHADVISTAQSFDGQSQASHTDCSAFVQEVFAANGISLPRDSASQYAATQHISRAEARPGDLVFFGVNGGSHVGIFEGGDIMVDNQDNGVKAYDHISYFDGPVSFGRVGGATNYNFSLAAAPKPQTNNNDNYAASQNNGNVQTNDQKTDNNQSDSNSQSDVNNQKTDNKQQNDTNKQNVDNNNDANKDAANKQASNVKDNGKTLPQTGQSNTAATSVLGMIMLSVLGFFGLKRRNANK